MPTVAGTKRIARFLIDTADEVPAVQTAVADQAAFIIGGHLRAEAPGHLGEKLETWVKGNRVQFYVPEYGMFVWKGTRPHRIVPKGPGYPLHFFVASGEEVFAMSVDHPGTKPNPFVERAVAKANPEVQALLGLEIGKRANRVR